MSINITAGFPFRFHYLNRESGFDLTKLSKIFTSTDYSSLFLETSPAGPWFHGLMWSQHATDNKKRKKLVLRKDDWVKFLTSFFTTGQRQKWCINMKFLTFSYSHVSMLSLFLWSTVSGGATALYDKTFSIKYRSRISNTALIWIFYKLTPHLCYGAWYRLRNKTWPTSDF